jgi:hypothetical protein
VIGNVISEGVDLLGAIGVDDPHPIAASVTARTLTRIVMIDSCPGDRQQSSAPLPCGPQTFTARLNSLPSPPEHVDDVDHDARTRRVKDNRTIDVAAPVIGRQHDETAFDRNG